MKAWTHVEYGPPDLLRLEHVDPPTAGRDEVVVRFGASTVNPYDWRHLRADPALVRLTHGLRRPRDGAVLGTDVAGVVESVGSGVDDVAVGDRVAASVATGAWADLVAVPRHRLALVPDGVDLVDAATTPMAGITALLAVRDVGRVGAGDRVLVLGASGGIGTFAVQLAVDAGAEVTGVASTPNLDLVREVGAAHVLDYTRDDVAAAGEHDVVVDVAGSLSLRDLRGLTRRDGAVVLVGGIANRGRLLGPGTQVLAGMAQGPFVPRRIGAVMWGQDAPATEHLDHLLARVAAGTVRPVVGRTFAFADVPAALAHGETRRTRGKAVITG